MLERREGNYFKISSEVKAEIGRWAAENAASATVHATV